MYNPSYELSILQAKLSRQWKGKQPRKHPIDERDFSIFFKKYGTNNHVFYVGEIRTSFLRTNFDRINRSSTRSIDRSSRFYFYDFDISSRVNSARFRRGEKLEKLKGRSKQFANFRDRWDIGRYWSRNSARQL